MAAQDLPASLMTTVDEHREMGATRPHRLSPEASPPVRQVRDYLVQPGWRLMIQDLGLSPEAVLRRAQLPVDLLARHDR